MDDHRGRLRYRPAQRVAIQRDARWLDVLPFLVLSLLAALPTVQLLETQRERFSFSFQIVPIMAAIAVVPYAAPLIGLLSAAVHVLRSRQRRLEKVLFNLANLPLAAGIAASIYLVLPPQTDGFWPVLAALGSVLVFYTSMLAWSG